MTHPTQLSRAIEFATLAHGEQVRKYTGQPYITHPIAVSRLVRRFGGDLAMQVAAVLHDTVEDTHVSPAEFEMHFGHDVAALVEHLTARSRKAPWRNVRDLNLLCLAHGVEKQALRHGNKTKTLYTVGAWIENWLTFRKDFVVG